MNTDSLDTTLCLWTMFPGSINVVAIIAKEMNI